MSLTLHDPSEHPRRGDALYVSGRRWRCAGADGDRVSVVPPVPGASTVVVAIAEWRELAARAEAVIVSLRGEG